MCVYFNLFTTSIRAYFGINLPKWNSEKQKGVKLVNGKVVNESSGCFLGLAGPISDRDYITDLVGCHWSKQDDSMEASSR